MADTKIAKQKPSKYLRQSIKTFLYLISPLQVTLLINNAGVVSGLHLLETPDHLIERSFNVNVIAHFWVGWTHTATHTHTYTHSCYNNNSLSLHRPQKRFCPKWSRRNVDISWRSPLWLAMLALANWSITVPANLQRLVYSFAVHANCWRSSFWLQTCARNNYRLASMRRCVWSWKFSDIRTYKPPAFARSSYRQRACLMMWMPGERIYGRGRCGNILTAKLFCFADGCPHWIPTMWPIASSRPLGRTRSWPSFPVSSSSCCLSSGK